MVVADYIIQDENQRQLLADEDSVVFDHICNFYPRLRQAVSLLSQHKVGELPNYYYRIINLANEIILVGFILLIIYKQFTFY